MSISHTKPLFPLAAGHLPRVEAARRQLRLLALALWRGLEAQGQARAAHDLRRLAQRWEPCDPAMAAQLRGAIEFNEQAGHGPRA